MHCGTAPQAQLMSMIAPAWDSLRALCCFLTISAIHEEKTTQARRSVPHGCSNAVNQRTQEMRINRPAGLLVDNRNDRLILRKIHDCVKTLYGQNVER